MGKGRVKKYVQSAIPSAISEKGGFSARFVSDGFSVDAKTEILPKVIKEQGLQIGEEPGWALIYSFLKACANHSASTGETVNIDSLMTFGLSIRGWFANKTSKATKENVRVTAKLLGDLRPTVNFSMSNANEGNTIMCYTVTTPGCPLDHVKQGAEAVINGKWLKMIMDGTDTDHVQAEATPAGGEKVTANCAITDSDDDHVSIVLPAAFNGAAFIGREIKFTVFGRTGDPEAGVQSVPITATLDAGEVEPVVPTVDDIASEGHEGEIVSGTAFAAKGSGLDAFDAEAGDTVKVKWTQGGEDKEATIAPSDIAADKLSFAFPDALVGVPMDTELTFEITFGEIHKTKGSKLVEA